MEAIHNIFSVWFLEINFLVNLEQVETIKLIIYQKSILSTFLLILMRFQLLLHSSVIVKCYSWNIGQYWLCLLYIGYIFFKTAQIIIT